MSVDRLLQDQVAAQPHPLLFATVSGAHLYGFPSPDSDYDLRGVHVLPAREVVGLEPFQETIDSSSMIEGSEIDLVTHDARKFFSLMLKRNGYVLEQLFSPLVVHTSAEHEELKEIGRSCITRHHVHHYLGFAQNEWKLFQKEERPRLKPLLYVYRVLLTGIHLMRTGEIEANLETLCRTYDETFLLPLIEAKRTGAERGTLEGADIERHATEVLRLTETLDQAGASSRLPDESTARPALNDLLVRLRLGSSISHNGS